MAPSSPKTEPPTARRLALARWHGEVTWSAPLSQAAPLLLAGLAGAGAARAASFHLATQLRAALSAGPPPEGAVAAFFSTTMALSLPLLGGAFAAALLVGLLQTGAVVAWGRLPGNRKGPGAPRGGPRGGPRGALRARLPSALGSLLGVVLVTGTAIRLLRSHARDLVHSTGSPAVAAALAAHAALKILLAAGCVGLGLGLVDYLRARQQQVARLSMTRAEVREEQRTTEGDPRLRAAQARARRSMAQTSIEAPRAGQAPPQCPTTGRTGRHRQNPEA